MQLHAVWTWCLLWMKTLWNGTQTLIWTFHKLFSESLFPHWPFPHIPGFLNSPSLSQPNDADGVLRTFAMDHSSVHSIPPHWTAVNSNFLSQLSVCRLLPALAALNLQHFFFFFLPAFLPLIEKHLSACCMFVGFSCSSAVSNFIAVDFSVLLMHYS